MKVNIKARSALTYEVCQQIWSYNWLSPLTMLIDYAHSVRDVSGGAYMYCAANEANKDELSLPFIACHSLLIDLSRSRFI